MKSPSILHSVHLGLLVFVVFGVLVGCPGEILFGLLFRWRASEPWIVMISFAVAAAAALLTVYGNYRIQLERYRSSLGQCPRCGYDLRASPSRCPECGRAIKISGSQI